MVTEAGDVHAVEDPRFEKILAPGAFCSHWQVKVGVPPVKVVESPDD